MIVVTGATGNYGRQVVDGLLMQLPAAQVGVSVRDVAKAADLQQQGVRVSQGNVDDPASLRRRCGAGAHRLRHGPRRGRCPTAQ